MINRWVVPVLFCSMFLFQVGCSAKKKAPTRVPRYTSVLVMFKTPAMSRIGMTMKDAHGVMEKGMRAYANATPGTRIEDIRIHWEGRMIPLGSIASFMSPRPGDTVPTGAALWKVPPPNR